MRNHPGFLLVSTVEHATSAALNASCNAPCVDPSFCPARSLHPSFLRPKSRESRSSRCCSATRINLVRVSLSCSRSRENDAGLRSFCFLSRLAMRTFRHIAVWSECTLCRRLVPASITLFRSCLLIMKWSSSKGLFDRGLYHVARRDIFFSKNDIGRHMLRKAKNVNNSSPALFRQSIP